MVSALVFATALIASSYLFTRDITATPLAEASTESALLEAIAKKDTDGDGLTDWEEVLYGTNPKEIDTKGLGISDGEAVRKGLIIPKAISDAAVAPSVPGETDTDGLPPPPAEGTLTDAFVKSFMASYAAARQANDGEDLPQEELQAIAAESIASLSSLVVIAPDFKSQKDLRISGNGIDALMKFAQEAEAIVLQNTANAGKSEVLYLKDAIENDDASALEHIASISKAYRTVSASLAALTIPQELADEMLALINTSMRIGELSADFARVNDDPLATIVALEQYPQAVQQFAGAFVGLSQAYVNAGISLKKDEPGAAFVNAMQELQGTP
jgi:hypothetical protein